MVSDTKFNYWAIDNDYAFPINTFFKAIAQAEDTEELKKISCTFRQEGLEVKNFTDKARLMNDYVDITVAAETLDEQKLETFLISVIRSQRKDVTNYESEPSIFKKIVNKILRK